jgi:hypothetical protein
MYTKYTKYARHLSAEDNYPLTYKRAIKKIQSETKVTGIYPGTMPRAQFHPKTDQSVMMPGQTFKGTIGSTQNSEHDAPTTIGDPKKGPSGPSRPSGPSGLSTVLTGSNASDLKISVPVPGKIDVKHHIIDLDYQFYYPPVGKGTYSQVYLAYHYKTMQWAAIKTLPIYRNIEHGLGSVHNFYKEAYILKNLTHPHLVAFHDFYQNPNFLYIVTEYLSYGSLYDVLDYVQDENNIKNIFAQIISALEYCHGNLIAHRDLKLENIMMAGKMADLYYVKLIDFGYATFVRPSLHKTPCGSPYYVAPEILTGKPYNPLKTDIWSLGILLYILAMGRPPYKITDNTKNHELLQMVKNFQLDAKTGNAQLDNLLGKIFTSVEKRCSLQEIKEDPWLQGFIQPNYLPYHPPTVPEEKILDQMASLGFHREQTIQMVQNGGSSMEISAYHILRWRQNYPKK